MHMAIAWCHQRSGLSAGHSPSYPSTGASTMPLLPRCLRSPYRPAVRPASPCTALRMYPCAGEYTETNYFEQLEWQLNRGPLVVRPAVRSRGEILSVRPQAHRGTRDAIALYLDSLDLIPYVELRKATPATCMSCARLEGIYSPSGYAYPRSAPMLPRVAHPDLHMQKYPCQGGTPWAVFRLVLSTAGVRRRLAWHSSRTSD